MLDPGPVRINTLDTRSAERSAAAEVQQAPQRKKKGSLAAQLDPLLQPRRAPGRPGRPQGATNYKWTPDADRMLIELSDKWGPTKAKPIMQRKLLELGVADGEARPDTLRKAVEHRMVKLGLPTGNPRKAPTSRTSKRWTEAQITALLGALGADATIESVAIRTGHSVKSVHAKLARLNYNVHEVFGCTVFTADQVADLLKVTPRQVRRWKEKGWLQTKGRRISERELGDFLCCHPEGIRYDELNRETQIYLVDIGYPGSKSVEFRKNVRQILDSVGRQRKYRRKVRANDESTEHEDTGAASAAESGATLA